MHDDAKRRAARKAVRDAQVSFERDAEAALMDRFLGSQVGTGEEVARSQTSGVTL